MRLSVSTAGAAMGVAAIPLLSVAGAPADLSVTHCAQLIASACAFELLIAAFLNSETARYELLMPVLGSSVINQLAMAFGLKAVKSDTRDAVITKVLGRRVTQRGLITKTIPLLICLNGGARSVVEDEVIRNGILYCLRLSGIELIRRIS